MADSHAQNMLNLAKLDREVFEILAPKTHLGSVAGFHAQQAAEKALKSVLDFKNITYPKTHNLLILVDLLRSSGLPCPANERSLVLLIRYAVEGRYDEEALSHIKIEPTREVLQVIFDWVSAVVDETIIQTQK
jgi:HEPN domain-containing protein